MAFDAIEICFGELNMRAEDHIMKAVQQVDVNVDKEKLIRAIKATDFVDELIYYIFNVQDVDDDNLSAEVICRKLVKHGLIDKINGHYEPKCEDCKWNTWDNNCIVEYRGCSFEPKADHKTENCSENPNNCEDEPTWEQVKEYCNKRCLDIVDSALRKKWYKDEPQTDMAEDIVRSYGFKAESYRQAKAKDEPQTDCPWRGDDV